MPGPLTSALVLSMALVTLSPQSQGGQVAAQIPEAADGAEARRAQQARLAIFAQGVPLAGTVGQGPAIHSRVNPKYTPGAMKAKVQGTVDVFAIIGTDGTVTRSAVDSPLDPELDQQALEALRQWRFAATLLNGQPTAVAVVVRMEFRLH